MTPRQTFRPCRCGNAQALVDESQLIIAADVTQQANDVQQVAPLLNQMDENLETAAIVERPREFLADAGYFSDDNTRDVVSREMVPYIATQRLKHHEELPPVPRGRIHNHSRRSSVWPVRCERRRAARPTRNEKDKSNPCSVRSNKLVVSANSQCEDFRR